MTGFPLFRQLRGVPRPFDTARAALGYRRFLDACSDQGHPDLAQALAGDKAATALFESLFGTSPYLEGLLIRDIGFLSRAINSEIEAAVRNVLESAPLVIGSGQLPDRAEAMRALRVAKGRAALLIAIADIGNLWSVPEVTRALSDFADTAVASALDYLVLEAAARGDLEIVDPAQPSNGSGLFVLGMGKLGARELNYSSDIDLIVLFDQELVRYVGASSPQDCFVRITRGLVTLLQERTPDGYVLRTDLRLRPDAGATPVALSVLAAETYYESVGQNWERAALIKARPVAGDIAAGNDFLKRISPFVWRKHLDFAAIADIHSIKRQIDAKVGRPTTAVAGHNIKLGHGGIREIEFFAQTQQLIAGGRDRTLRDSTTCGAIRALARTNRIAPKVAGELIECYEFLRRVEHRLQMIADEQTQRVPEDDGELRRLAIFLGYPGVEPFSNHLLGVLETVRRHYAALFEDAPALGTDTGSLVFTGTEDDPETIETLSRLGYREPSVVSSVVRRWHHGRLRATRSVRARELLTALGPKLLSALAATANPDAAFLKFDEFLAKLPAGIPVFSLFYSNPALLDLVAEIMGGAPRLAEFLSRTPTILDSLLSEEVLDVPPDKPALADHIATDGALARDYQDTLDISRRWARDRRFLVGVRVLRGTMLGHDAGPHLSNIADAVLAHLLAAVRADFASRHGHVPGSEFAIAALGKLGSREMTFGSDLDLTFIYRTGGEAVSDGPRPLTATAYFARLSQQVIAAITSLTAEGRLYDIDMRLRPSGTSGPIAVSLAGFDQYQRQSAWTWEKMALTRARFIAGDPGLSGDVAAAIQRSLDAAIDPTKLRRDVLEMRQRVAEQFPEQNCWRLKYVRGGLMDAEFLCQYLQLRFGGQHREIFAIGTVDAFERIEGAGVLPVGMAARLAGHVILFHNVEALLRLCLDGEIDEASFPAGLTAGLGRLGGGPDLAAVRRRLIAAQADVLTMFRTLVEQPATAD